jgi:glycosyltransferase involved in cell wall biosynthesis
MKILFFDIEISGHHSEYISHIVDYLCYTKAEGSYFFLVHPEFSASFPEIVNKANTSENIRFIAISYKELHCVSKGVLIKQSIEFYRLMNKYALTYSITKVVLLYFNNFQFALGIFRPYYEIDGILFLQFSRMQKTTLKEKLKYFRKYWQTWFFARNRQIKHIFVLNDPKSVVYLNRELKTKIFKVLPDPVPIFTPMPDFLIRETFNIESNRRILLHFGGLAERKGTFAILEAFNHLEINDIHKIALLLIGKADAKTNNIILGRIAALKKKYPESLIVYKNEFVPYSMMKSFFDQCDIVLIPYTNVETSSGIIGHAIASNKPVIGINNGLLGEMIVENKAGIAIEKSTPELIASGIVTALKNPVIGYKNEKYLTEHSIEMFASIILM